GGIHDVVDHRLVVDTGAWRLQRLEVGFEVLQELVLRAAVRGVAPLGEEEDVSRVGIRLHGRIQRVACLVAIPVLQQRGQHCLGVPGEGVGGGRQPARLGGNRHVVGGTSRGGRAHRGDRAATTAATAAGRAGDGGELHAVVVPAAHVL